MDYRPLIEEFAAGGKLLADAIAGLSDAQLKAHPVPGTWSIQEIVIHLQDSDGIGIDRMKRLAAEDNPLLIGYDETKFVRSLKPELQSTEDAVAIFDLTRRQFARVLRALPAEAFERTGIHNEIGKVKLGVQVQKYQEHLLHHLKFIAEKRAKISRT